MRYYKENELKTIIENMEKYWPDGLFGVGLDDLKDVALAKNTKKKKAIYLKEFKSKYVLHIGDYFDNEHQIIGANDLNTDDDRRYPIIVVYTDSDDIPDMYVLSEYATLMKIYDDDEEKVIVVDKITRPGNEKLLDEMAKDYGVEYDKTLYQLNNDETI